MVLARHGDPAVQAVMSTCPPVRAVARWRGGTGRSLSREVHRRHIVRGRVRRQRTRPSRHSLRPPGQSGIQRGQARSAAGDGGLDPRLLRRPLAQLGSDAEDLASRALTHGALQLGRVRGTAQTPADGILGGNELYYGLYAAWTDPADDRKSTDWVTGHMRAWEPYASGIQLADENLINRPIAS